MDVEQKLNDPIEDGEVLRVKYAGGSQPGAEREIAPISVKDGRVRARCYTSKAVKLFAIDKITVLGNTVSTGQVWDGAKAAQGKYVSLAEVEAAFRPLWESQGWTVESGPDRLSLHTIGKHGKLLKAPSIALTREETTTDWVFNLDTGDFEGQEKPRDKPWTIAGKNFGSRAFKHLDGAVEVMKSWADESAPVGKFS